MIAFFFDDGHSSLVFIPNLFGGLHLLGMEERTTVLVRIAVPVIAVVLNDHLSFFTEDVDEVPMRAAVEEFLSFKTRVRHASRQVRQDLLLRLRHCSVLAKKESVCHAVILQQRSFLFLDRSNTKLTTEHRVACSGVELPEICALAFPVAKVQFLLELMLYDIERFATFIAWNVSTRSFASL